MTETGCTMHTATLMLAAMIGCSSSPKTCDHSSGAACDVPRHYLCHCAQGEIIIDGRLDDAAWAGADWTDPFVDIEGGEMPAPRYKTRAKMLWDKRYLYIAAELEEPHVWGKLTEYDQVVYDDNDFEIFIDPDGDTEQYYEVEVNALNTIFDLFLVKTYIDGGPALHAWDLKGMKHAVHVEGTLNDPSDIDKCWSVEFALPWEVLKEAAHMQTPPEDGDTWRINFSRVQWRHQLLGEEYQKVPGTAEDNWVWSPQGVINMHLPQYWGYVKFVDNE